MIVLAGDIGGTHARLAFYERHEKSLRELLVRIYLNERFDDFAAVLRQFMSETPLRPQASCLGVAGPVVGGQTQITNLPWIVSAQHVADDLQVQHSHLLNDLEATAYGVFALKAHDLEVLQRGDPQSGNACIIAAGTGLGEAGLIWTGQRYLPVACEGGHASFAPTSPLEMQLWSFLTDRFGHVSCERVVSGLGLVNIYSFARTLLPHSEPESLRDRLQTPEAASLISQAASDGTSPAAQMAMELFVKCYAAEAANLALKMMSRGGVYIAGGIAPKILPQLRHPQFLEAFIRKGRMGELLRTFPVRVILNPQVALMGAAWFAAFGQSLETPTSLF
jgi:glucokinase